MVTKQIGNLASVCANRNDVLLQILNGKATVHVGQGPDKKCMIYKPKTNCRISA